MSGRKAGRRGFEATLRKEHEGASWTGARTRDIPRGRCPATGMPRNVGIERTSEALEAFEINHGEFDPGSERTLAARLKHASRTARRGACTLP